MVIGGITRLFMVFIKTGFPGEIIFLHEQTGSYEPKQLVPKS